MEGEPDGTPLDGGVVVSRAGGFRVAVYRCACGREQTARHEGFPGGVGEASAESVGWRKVDGRWVCPFCSGNTANLCAVFGR